MSLSRSKSLRSAISRSTRRWRERANHRATVKRAPAMSPLSRALGRDRALGAASLEDSLRAIELDMAGLRSLIPGRASRPDGAGSIGAGKACPQSMVSRDCPNFIHGGEVASLSPTAECDETI